MGLRELLKSQRQRRARRRRKRDLRLREHYKDLHEKAKRQPFGG